MKSPNLLLILVAAALVVAAGAARALAQEAPPDTRPPVDAARGSAVVMPTPTPLVAELLEIVAAERKRLTELRRDIAAARDPQRARELQREVETLKRETEKQLLRVQIRHARAEGRLPVAEQLEATLALLEERQAASGGRP